MASKGNDEKTPAEVQDNPNGGEQEKMLKKEAEIDGENGQEVKGGKAQKDAESGQAAKKVGSSKEDKMALIGTEELEQYRKDPFWRGMRFIIFGILAVLFLLLLVTAILLVVLSPSCGLEQAQPLRQNGTGTTSFVTLEPSSESSSPPSTTQSTMATSSTKGPPPPPAKRPRVDSYLMVASVGDPVHFRCWQCQFAQCQTGHRLHWRKVQANGEPEEQPQQQLQVERDAQSAFLIFPAVGYEHAGIYECADEETGYLSSPVHLQVEPPRIPVIYPWHQTASEGAQILIRCTVPGHPDAQLSWRLENGVEAARLYGVRDHGNGMLEIQAVRPEHEPHGYVCWAIYPRRADKLALHAGPAKIRVIKRTEEEARNDAATATAVGGGGISQPVQNHPAPAVEEVEEGGNESEFPAGAAEGGDEVGTLRKAPEMPEAPLNGQGNEEEEEEGSGEAVIKIEPLLDYVQATAKKLNDGDDGDQENDGEK